MGSSFFKEFIMISSFNTIIFLVILFGLFGIIKVLEKKKVSFSKRMLIGIAFGLILGVLIQASAKFPNNPMDITYIKETIKWYSLFGNGFIDLIRMLVIPLILVSIIHVIINMKDGANLGKLTRNTILIAVIMVFIATIVGLVIGSLLKLGSGIAVAENSDLQIKDVKNIVDTLRGLIPANPVGSMVDLNVIGLVIFAVFFGIAAKRMSKKYMDIVKPFFDLINALQKIIMSIAMTIIKWMPYAVVALLANTIAQKGLNTIKEVGIFIFAIYLSLFIMFIIQLIAISLFGLNPFTYVKKAVPVFILAFTSRSSMGTLPLTIETLSNKMGVNEGTSSFVAGFGTTACMQGCAGIFPALILVFVSNVNGIPMDFNFIAMSIIVILIGSFGIAGIPGTATMAASVTLSGMGLASHFASISPVISVDPIIDMGRTALNVSGAMTNALMVDKTLGQINIEVFKDTTKAN